MKRILVAGILILLIIIALIAMLPLWFSSETVKERILDEARMLTGRELSFRGTPSVSFSPFLGIEILDVIIEDPLSGENGPPFVQMERMQARLEILSAFFGQPDITDFKFFRPQFNLKQYGTGQANWVLESGAIYDQIEAPKDQTTQNNGGQPTQPPDPVKLGKFEIVDGTLDYEDEISGTTHKITNLNGSVSWPTTQSALSVNANAIWRGEQIALKATFSEFLSLFSGKAIDTEFAFVSAPVTIQFAGQSDVISDIHLAGDITINSPSFNRLSKFFAISAFDGIFFSELNISGKFDGTTKKAGLSDATVALGGSLSTGALSWSLDEADNSKLDGTLAFDSINLDQMFEEFPDFRTDTDGETGEKQPDQFQLDLRLSANTVSLSDITATDFAATLSSREDVWFLDIGNVSLFDGTIIAKVEADFTDLAPNYSVNATGTKLNMASISQTIGSTLLQPTGTVKVKVEAASSGYTLLDAARNLNGDAEFEASQSTLSGIDISLLYEALAKKKYRLVVNEIRGSSIIENQSLKVAVEDGIAWTIENEFNTADHQVKLIGNADVYFGGLAMRADVSKLVKQADETPSKTEETRSLFVGGTIRSPLFTRWRLQRDNSLR